MVAVWMGVGCFNPLWMYIDFVLKDIFFFIFRCFLLHIAGHFINTSSQFRWKTGFSNPYARLGTYCYLLAAINFQSPIVWHFMQVIHVDACSQYEFQFFIWHELIAQICWFWSPVVCLFISKLFIISYLSLELPVQGHAISAKFCMKHHWVKGIQVCKNEAIIVSLEKRVKIHWQLAFKNRLLKDHMANFKQTFLWIKGIQFFLNEGPHPFQRENDNNIVKHLKSSSPEPLEWTIFNQSWHKATLGERIQVSSNEGLFSLPRGDGTNIVKNLH